MHTFLKYIRQYHPINNQDWEQIASVLQFEQIEKNDILLPEGKICRYLYFVEEGLLRFFFLKNGKEVTKYFTEAPYLFTSQQSFTQNAPALESIQAIEDCRLYKIAASDADRLWQIPAWGLFIRQLLNEVQHFTTEIYTEVQTELAEDRYRRLLAEEPQLIQRIPLKYLASYLGIAPQSLSRIRKKIALEGHN